MCAFWKDAIVTILVLIRVQRIMRRWYQSVRTRVRLGSRLTVVVPCEIGIDVFGWDQGTDKNSDGKFLTPWT